MPNPIITIMNSSNSTAVSEWHLGTLKSTVPSDILSINVWNNKGGAVDVSDLVDVVITTVNINGGNTDEEAVVNKWTYACVTATATAGSDGVKKFTQIGGDTGTPVAADGVSGNDLTNHVIKGTANDGTSANSRKNFASIKLKVIPPVNASAGSHRWRVKIQGYFS